MYDHTPGPWRWRYGGCLMAGNTVVAGHADEMKPSPADARLIKMAPTMYEVLDDHYDTIISALGTQVARSEGDSDVTKRMNKVKRDLDFVLSKVKGDR